MKLIIFFIVLASGLYSGELCASEREVAFIEEIIILPDGSEQVRRYRPHEVVAVNSQPMRIEPQTPPKPRQRGLNTVERLELDRLEEAFAHGRISESEYYNRKRQILRGTYVDGPPNDRLFERSVQF